MACSPPTRSSPPQCVPTPELVQTRRRHALETFWMSLTAAVIGFGVAAALVVAAFVAAG
jgi:hypothetical protein